MRTGRKEKPLFLGKVREPFESESRMFRVLTLLLAMAAVLRAETPAESVRAMVEAERKFYQTGQENGTRAAFLKFLAEDSIVFRPGPVSGQETWSKRLETGLDLVWEPTFAVMARSADFGYDTGPAKWRAAKSDPKFSGYGYFISVWKKQKDGSWKVVVDCGGETPEPAGTPEALRMIPNDKERRVKPVPEASLKKLTEAQQKLAGTAKTDSGKAALAVASEDVRVYRAGRLPAIGLSAGGGRLLGQSKKIVLETLGGEMSRSGDLAYTYGKYSTVDADAIEQGHYLQIWQTDELGVWKLCLDWQQPLPPK
jgi:ketosteroid isomerase-like protein